GERLVDPSFVLLRIENNGTTDIDTDDYAVNEIRRGEGSLQPTHIKGCRAPHAGSPKYARLRRV
ncbi:hypothetical protein AB0E55_29815, partial [Amycolatopsis keratiniphila]|uniref:hypothetical protein n=1 Tax=Amycolatopsis keratiniphila TaxID=129921 RepID=UPI0033F5083D